MAEGGARFSGLQGRGGTSRKALARHGPRRQSSANWSRPCARRGMAAHPVRGPIPRGEALSAEKYHGRPQEEGRGGGGEETASISAAHDCYVRGGSVADGQRWRFCLVPVG